MCLLRKHISGKSGSNQYLGEGGNKVILSIKKKRSEALEHI